MNNISTILILAISTLTQAQTTLLCEDDFNTSVVNCNIISSPLLQKTNGVFLFTFRGFADTQQSFDISLPDNLSDFDTLRLEMDLNIMRTYSTYSHQILFSTLPYSIFLNYTDATNNKNYTGYINEVPSSPYIYLPNAQNTYTANKLVTKAIGPVGNSNHFMVFNPPAPIHIFQNASWGNLNQTLTSNYNSSIDEDPSFVTKIKDFFCSTTDNPVDCKTKVIVDAPQRPPIQFEIDNFKAYGIKAVVTGLEEEIKPVKTRTLVGIYNSLGQKLDADQTHEGLVIKMYSDGTKEKVAMK